MFRGIGLAFEIDIRSEVDDSADGPTEGDAYDPAENSHSAGFRKEEAFYVGIAGADGFHDSDLAAAFEDGHHQRIHDSDKCDCKRQAAKDSEEDVEHFEELLNAAAGVEDGESIESHLLN